MKKIVTITKEIEVCDLNYCDNELAEIGFSDTDGKVYCSLKHYNEARK